MKKLLIVLLSLALIFAFAACGQTEAPAEEAPAEEEVVFLGLLNMNGTTEEEHQRWHEENFPMIEPTVSFVFFDDMSSMMLALDKGDIELFAVSDSTARYIVASAPQQYAATIMDENTCYSMIAAEENAELIRKIDTTLEALEADGTMAALQEEYLDNCDPAAMPTPMELPRFENGEAVRVVVTGDLPPMDYMTTDGQAAGYNIALLSAIAEQTQINFELVSANAASRALMITSGKADLVFWSSMEQVNGEIIGSEDIPEGMIASRPYLTDSIAMITLAQPIE